MKEVYISAKTSDFLHKISLRSQQNTGFYCEKYLQIGSKIIRLICRSEDFISPIDKQLSYVIKDSAMNYDATIILWREKTPQIFAQEFIDSHLKSRIRLQQLALKTKNVEFEISEKIAQDQQINIRIKIENNLIDYLEILDGFYSKHNPIIGINAANGIVYAHDEAKNIYYYGVENLDPEEFIKQGHIFVQIFNKILKSPNSALVHGAVVGLENKGILFCARGQRGKSTLAVLAMMKGFEYVADDYLLLEKEGSELYSHPIYSIITLSPRMYNKLYGDMKGQFVSNNARRDKYVFDIKNYHDSFRSKYPIKICMFPQIVSDAKPSITSCKKGRAITQLVHSTISQMNDKHDIKTIQKLISFVRDFDFYQINLCPDIEANVECLREFYNKKF